MPVPKKDPKTGKWFFVFDYYDHGKRKQIRRRGFKTKREANELMIELQKQINHKEYIPINKQTLGEFIYYWLENERKMQCEAGTFYNEQLFFKNHIQAKIGQIKIQDLNPMICQKFINDLHEEGYSYSTIRAITSVIKLALDRAIIYKLIKDNCMRKTILPKRNKREMKVWNTEQINHFLLFTKGRRFYIVYMLALITGMRQGEILGLKWNDVDLDKRTITIRQILDRHKRKLKTGAKTEAGKRVIQLPNLIIPILKQQRKYYLELKLQIGNSFKDLDLVIFNGTNGGLVFPSNLHKVYAKDVEESGLPYIRFHDLRHTHATMLLEQGVNPKVIQERLGHSNIKMTLDTYSHILPSMQEKVANKIDDIIQIFP